MVQKLSIHKTVQEIFLRNPHSVYASKDLVSIIDNKYNHKAKKEIVTTILTRLYRKGLIQRTPTQLTNGYFYSLKNVDLLKEAYENYLLPYGFNDKNILINQLRKREFEKIDNNSLLDLNIVKESNFVKKYPFKLFQSNETQQFLASLVGFVMCDGSINEKSNKVRFFLRRKTDANLFVKNFRSIFQFESFKIKPDNQGASYTVEIIKGSSVAKFLNKLGAPNGNKIFHSFFIPDWVFHGPNEIKKIFLSTAIGNEGSAPSNNRWRIQFVLSKSKEHVPNLIEFLNQIRTMLYHFNITTSHIQLRRQKDRQFNGRFYIKGKENLRKFYKQFKFLYASEKQEVLEDLISRNP